MKRICAWCTKELGEIENSTGGTTHGICDDCLLHHFPHLYEKVNGIIIEKEEKIGNRKKS